MTHQERIDQLAGAIKRAVEAHGNNNRFTVGELRREFRAPHTLISSYLLRAEMPDVQAAAGYRLEYVPGRPCYVVVREALGKS